MGGGDNRKIRMGKDFGVQHEKALRELEAPWVDYNLD